MSGESSYRRGGACPSRCCSGDRLQGRCVLAAPCGLCGGGGAGGASPSPTVVGYPQEPPQSPLSARVRGRAPAVGFAPRMPAFAVARRASPTLPPQSPSVTAPPWGSISAAAFTVGGGFGIGCSRTLSSPPWGVRGVIPLEGVWGCFSLMPPFPPKSPACPRNACSLE